MRKAAFWATVAALGLPAAALAPAGEAGAAEARSTPYRDIQACYEVKEYPSTRIVLDIKFHSRLGLTKEGGAQAVYDADGKHAYTEGGKNRMAVFDGAIVTSSGSYSQPPGAHLGGTSYFVRGSALGPKGGQQKPIFWECTSDEKSPAPGTFYCSIQTGSDTLPATLVRQKYPTKECDVYQDTKEYPY